MAKFKVFATTKHDYIIEIEASSIEEAREEARFTPVQHWSNRGYDFILHSIEEAN